MTRRASFLHRTPPTRRERMLVRLHAVRDGARRRWAQLRHHSACRADHLRAQELFLHLGRAMHPHAREAVVRTHHGRSRLRHHRG